MTEKWTATVEAVSLGLEQTGYAHQIRIPGTFLPITVAHTQHQNYDYIHQEDIGNGYFRYTGIGRREPDLTPVYLARLIAAVPEMKAYVERNAELGDQRARDLLEAIGKPESEVNPSERN